MNDHGPSESNSKSERVEFSGAMQVQVENKQRILIIEGDLTGCVENNEISSERCVGKYSDRKLASWRTLEYPQI